MSNFATRRIYIYIYILLHPVYRAFAIIVDQRGERGEGGLLNSAVLVHTCNFIRRNRDQRSRNLGNRNFHWARNSRVLAALD